MQLFPQKSFTIVRQLSVAPYESGTYYVQAVVRNAHTDAVVETVNLTHQGTYRYSGAFVTPADPTNFGYYLSIVTNVYTDSGYTTKSEVFSPEENTYLVRNLETGKGGGWVGIDASDVRRVVREEIAKIPQAPEFDYSRIPTPERYEMRWDEVLSAVEGLKTALKPIQPQKVDLSPVISAIDNVIQAVNDKPVTEATDIQPILSKMDELVTKQDELNEENKSDREEKSTNTVAEIKKAVTEALDNMGVVSIFTHKSKGVPEPVKKEEKEDTLDVKELMS